MQNDFKCMICDESEFEEVEYNCTNDEKKLLDLKKIRICKKCGFGVAYPYLSQDHLDKFYSDGEYWRSMVQNPYQIAHAINQAIVRVKYCNQFIKEDTIVLDVGAAHGEFAIALEYLDVTIEKYCVVEPDESNLAAIENTNFRFPVEQVKDINQIAKMANLVVLSHVLEHVQNPNNFISEVTSNLDSGAVVYIEVPNRDFDYKDSVFPHTLFFNMESLCRLADNCGMTILSNESFGCWPKTNDFFSRAVNGLVGKLFKLSVKIKFRRMQSIFDTIYWKYSIQDENSPWLRILLKKI